MKLSRGREDKPREDLLKEDNEGKIGSEIAYSCSTNSSPHTDPYCIASNHTQTHTHTPLVKVDENGIKKRKKKDRERKHQKRE